MSVVSAGEGRRLRAGGNDITVLVHPDGGARDLSMFESLVPPGGRVRPHLHREYEEAFYVLDGEFSFLVGETWARVGPGSTVHVARGVIHAFANESGRPARLLVVHTPAAAIRMIEEMAALPAEATPAAAAAVLARHASEPVLVAETG